MYKWITFRWIKNVDYTPYAKNDQNDWIDSITEFFSKDLAIFTLFWKVGGIFSWLYSIMFWLGIGLRVTKDKTQILAFRRVPIQMLNFDEREIQILNVLAFLRGWWPNSIMKPRLLSSAARQSTDYFYIYRELITFTLIKYKQITIMVLTMDLSNQAILEVTKGIYKDALAMKSEQQVKIKSKKQSFKSLR